MELEEFQSAPRGGKWTHGNMWIGCAKPLCKILQHTEVETLVPQASADGQRPGNRYAPLTCGFSC